MSKITHTKLLTECIFALNQNLCIGQKKKISEFSMKSGSYINEFKDHMAILLIYRKGKLIYRMDRVISEKETTTEAQDNLAKQALLQGFGFGLMYMDQQLQTANG